MAKYILRRVLGAIPVLLIVITGTFFLIRAAPGGPFDSEKAVSAEVKEALNERYKLNDPFYIQYFDYLANLVQGDFGPSFKYPGRTVGELIASGLPITFELGLYAMIVAIFFGLLAGVWASLKPNTLQDYIPMSLAMIGICMPTFLLGPVLVLIFGFWLEILPVAGWESFEYKILPAITLGATYAAYIARLSRTGMIETLSQDFVRTARAKGVSEVMIVIRHTLKGGIVPVVSFLGPAVAGLLAGSFVVETIFQIPGLGRFYVQAAFNRDYTMIMGTTIFLSALIIIFNLISDVIHVWLDPRLSYESGPSK